MWHWFALLSITVLINVPMLAPTLLFSNDTLHALIFFHDAYSEVIAHHEFPRWLPYLAFGTVFDFNLYNTIQPTDFVMMAVGWLCGIKDSLLLFKISLILCQAVLVLGLYLLSRACFTSMLSVWMVCLGGLLTTSWMFCAPWSLTAYYMVPLVLWLLLRFLESKKPTHLWLAGLVEVLSLLGTVPYIAPLHLFIVVAFLVPFLCRDPGLWRTFVNWRNFVHPLFFVFCGYFLLIGLWVAGIDVVWMAPVRNAETGNVPLEAFLGRPGSGADRQPLGVMLRMLVKGDLYYGDLVIYMGILPLATLCYALLRRRDTLFLSLAVVTLALFWLSLGGWFATLTYYCFPLMNKYRFISAVWNFLRIFLLLLGGFGFDQILRDLRGVTAETRPAVFSRRARWTIFMVLACCLVDHLFNLRLGAKFGAAADTATDFVFNGQAWPQLFERQRADLAGFELTQLLRYFAYAFIFGLLWALSLSDQRAGHGRAPWGGKWIQAVGPVLLGLYLADVGFFYSQVMRQAPWCPPGTPVAETFTVHKTIYRPQRYELERMPADAVRTQQVIVCPRGGSPEQNRYGSADVLMQADFVVPAGRLDLMMASVKAMFDARVRPPLNWLDSLRHDLPFRRSVGESLDKARMVRDHDVLFVDNEKQAQAVFSTLADPDRKIVLVGTPPALPGGATAKVPETSAKIEEPTVFSANRVVFKVPAGGAGWLFYADAYDPAWKALVDGRPAQVMRANVGFKAVQVPKGAAEVAFYFDGGWRDWYCLAYVAASTLLTFALVGFLLAAPWVLTMGANIPQGSEYPPLGLGHQAVGFESQDPGMVPVWSAYACLATFAGGLFLFTDFMCMAPLLVVAACAVFIVHNRGERPRK